MVRTVDVGFVPAFHAAIRGSSFVRDTYTAPARHTPDLAKAWQEEFVNDGGGPFPKRSPVSLFAQKKRREPLSGASTACPTPRAMTPVSNAPSDAFMPHGGNDDLHSQWIEISEKQQRPQSARPRSAGGRSAQADLFEYRLGTPGSARAQFAEERALQRQIQVEFQAKALGREYCGESWLQRIERRVEKAATPVTVLNPQVHRPSPTTRDAPQSPSRGQPDSEHRRERPGSKDMPSEMVPMSPTNVRRHSPKPPLVQRSRLGRKQMGTGRKAKATTGNQPLAEFTEALMRVQVAPRHIVLRKMQDGGASRQLSVLHPACPRYPDLATESSQMGVEWTLNEDHFFSADELNGYPQMDQEQPRASQTSQTSQTSKQTSQNSWEGELHVAYQRRTVVQ